MRHPAGAGERARSTREHYDASIAKGRISGAGGAACRVRESGDERGTAAPADLEIGRVLLVAGRTRPRAGVGILVASLDEVAGALEMELVAHPQLRQRLVAGKLADGTDAVFVEHQRVDALPREVVAQQVGLEQAGGGIQSLQDSFPRREQVV